MRWALGARVMLWNEIIISSPVEPVDYRAAWYLGTASDPRLSAWGSNPTTTTTTTDRALPTTLCEREPDGATSHIQQGPLVMRVSTAGTGESGAVNHLLGQLPNGLVLNLGSGTTGATDGAQRLVNVDHVAPEGDRPPGLIVVADAHHLPFADASFDAVLAKDVLEHVEDPIAVLRELSRTARPAAAIVAVVPRAIARAVWDDPTHIRGFTKRAIATALEHGGWRPTAEVRRLGGFPGAGRLGLAPHLETLMRLPGLGHWFGRNWLVRAVPRP